MRKIPTVFQRDHENPRFVTNVLCWEFAPALLFAAGCTVVFNVVLWAFRRARRVLS